MQYKVTYTQDEVNNILNQLKEAIDREIVAAINSNYAGIDVRSARGINAYEDCFCQYCYGEIHALTGIQDYIDETISELTGVRYE